MDPIGLRGHIATLEYYGTVLGTELVMLPAAVFYDATPREDYPTEWKRNIF